MSGAVQVQASIHMIDERWRMALRDCDSFISQWINEALTAVITDAARSFEVGVLCGDDATLRQYNHDYRGKNQPTNILSFSCGDVDEEGNYILGDLLLSIDTIQREAVEQGKAFSDHLAHMLVHGMLHLLGYDHETEDEAEQMEQYERDILARKNIADPYQHDAIL